MNVVALLTVYSVCKATSQLWNKHVVLDGYHGVVDMRVPNAGFLSSWDRNVGLLLETPSDARLVILQVG